MARRGGNRACQCGDTQHHRMISPRGDSNGRSEQNVTRRVYRYLQAVWQSFTSPCCRLLVRIYAIAIHQSTSQRAGDSAMSLSHKQTDDDAKIVNNSRQ